MSGPTLVDCGCEARVHADGSGIEIDFCPLHDAAPELLATMREIARWTTHGGDKPENTTTRVVNSKARAAIDKAEGGDMEAQS
jgi:hypothetical protein